jgi:hypothetical protein
MPTSEKIETIIFSFLKSGTAAGTFGAITATTSDDDGCNRRFTVQADGRTFLVGTDRHGWHVTAGNFTAHDRDLLEAAHLAINA